MISYISRRLLVGVFVAFAVVTAVFFTLHITPGDPLSVIVPPSAGATQEMMQNIKEKYKLDEPMYVQYFAYLKRVARLDFGESYITGRSVRDTLIRRYPSTIKLALASLFVATLIGIPAGVLSAIHQNKIIDSFSRVFALLGISIPNFWLGLILILFFSLRLEILPSLGSGGPIWTWAGIKHLILPAITLGTASSALIMRLTRSSMLEVLQEDYVRTARSKGVKERTVIFYHTLRNAVLPVITVLGLRFGVLLGGAVVIETIFSWPGVGRYVVQAITSNNFPAVQGAVLFMSFGFITVNLLVDIVYCWVDPRITYS